MLFGGTLFVVLFLEEEGGYTFWLLASTWQGRHVDAIL
jgi:hypothetical protein